MADNLDFWELLEQVRPEVDRALTAIWEESRAEYMPFGAAASRPLEAARELSLRGGKRLRAALVAAGHGLGGESEDWRRALPVCCAVELLQAYFLIHDDWMDQDRMRRGGPSVHAALEAHVGSAHLAACGAVLAGDYTLALATRVLARADVSEGRFAALLSRFAQLQLDAVVGQELDVLGDGGNLDDVYRLKTASYTVMGPLELGMELGGGPRLAREDLEAFAVPLGIAFQLRDDLIGAFADSAVSGKPRGSDLRAGKRTLLVETALAIADPPGQLLIRAVFGNAGAQAEAIEAALRAIEASGAPRAVEAKITALSQRADAALACGAFDASTRRLLAGVRAALLDRMS